MGQGSLLMSVVPSATEGLTELSMEASVLCSYFNRDIQPWLKSREMLLWMLDREARRFRVRGRRTFAVAGAGAG
jgi:hypothetical protein